MTLTQYYQGHVADAEHGSYSRSTRLAMVGETLPQEVVDREIAQWADGCLYKCQLCSDTSAATVPQKQFLVYQRREFEPHLYYKHGVTPQQYSDQFGRCAQSYSTHIWNSG